MNITFTQAASDYIKTMVEKEHGLGFRLSIKKTGCSGYSYAPTIVDAINANDLELNSVDNVKIFIDPTWQHLLEDIQVDYIEEVKSGLKQKKLIFTNPNETTRCGCGESFHVGNEAGK